MSETDTYTVSFKTGPGYDAALVVVRGDTPQELEDNMISLHASVLESVVETQGLLFAAAGVAAPAPQAAQGAPAWAGQQQAPPPQQQGGTGRFCEHGQRSMKTGNGKRGPWTGYFCALPKGTPGACDVVWE
jgi:hypothetical protein